jgi:hypothetical protein
VGLRPGRIAAVVEPAETLVLVEDARDRVVEGVGVSRVERRRGRADERLERRRGEVGAEELLVQSTKDVRGGMRGAVVGPTQPVNPNCVRSTSCSPNAFSQPYAGVCWTPATWYFA